MDITYNGRMTGEARFDWDATSAEHDFGLDIPLVADWVASYAEDDDALDVGDITIIGVRVAWDGCWKALEHKLLPEIRESWNVRSLIADWLNEHYADLLASDGDDALIERGAA